MDYKREKQISNEELNSFRTIEINKIMTKTSSPLNKGLLLKGFMSLLISGALVLVLLGVLLSPNNENVLPVDPNDPAVVVPDDNDETEEENNNPYTPDPEKESNLVVTKVTPLSYKVEYKADDFTLVFTYDAHVVYEGERQVLDENFDLYQRYTYAPQEVQDLVDIDFHVFQIGENRFYIDVTINSVHQYSEFSYFAPHNGKVVSGLQNVFEFVDFEEDINTLFDLIEEYPPVFLEEQYGVPRYDINPLITSLEDERMVEMYTKYVKYYYYDETYGGTEYDRDTEYMHNDTLVIMNDQNEIEKFSLNSHSSDKEITTSNVVENSVGIVLTDETFMSKSLTMFEDSENQFSSSFAKFTFEDQKYRYLFVSEQDSLVDIDAVDTVKFVYTVHGEENPTETLFDAIHFGGALLTEPMIFPTFDTGFDKVHSVHVVLYDVNGEILYEFDARI